MRSLTHRDPGPATYTVTGFRMQTVSLSRDPLSIDHNETNVVARVIESIMLLMIGALAAARGIIIKGTDDERLECSRKWKVNVRLMYVPDGMLINALGKLNVSFFLWLSVKCFVTSRRVNEARKRNDVHGLGPCNKFPFKVFFGREARSDSRETRPKFFYRTYFHNISRRLIILLELFSNLPIFVSYSETIVRLKL